MQPEIQPAASPISEKPTTCDIEVFSTCPQSKDFERDLYLERLIDVARWSEEFGCRGILVYTDNSIVDPWLVSQLILENTRTLAPLVAVQPIYLHPYAVAKMVASLAHLHQRRIYLNMLAGGFKNDLEALNDTTPHDQRYERMMEYTLIIRKLLESPAPVTFEGKYYTVRKLRMTPALPPELFPGILCSGSSEAGLAAAAAVGATAVKYTKPPAEEEAAATGADQPSGVRVGIVARESGQEAWAVARRRFPEDRQGQIAHQLAMKVSDSQWHKQLAVARDGHLGEDDPYWLGPFQNYKTFCPYLVGSYQRVAAEVARYIALGHTTFILDIPPSREELSHVGEVFRKAAELVER
jgi:alkanesulfonate monooxygenase